MNIHNYIHNYSEACARNQQVICEQLAPVFAQSDLVLEIGSGSGQHAIHFCQTHPHLNWQCSDQDQWLAGLDKNIEASELPQITPPIQLDVNTQWPNKQYSLIYTANSLHIMSMQSVQALFSNLNNHLTHTGYFCCYGPFKYHNAFTSSSNEQFDSWLKNRDPMSGIRDFEVIFELAKEQQLKLISDIQMPANNQLLIWQKQS